MQPTPPRDPAFENKMQQKLIEENMRTPEKNACMTLFQGLSLFESLCLEIGASLTELRSTWTADLAELRNSVNSARPTLFQVLDAIVRPLISYVPYKRFQEHQVHKIVCVYPLLTLKKIDSADRAPIYLTQDIHLVLDGATCAHFGCFSEQV